MAFDVTAPVSTLMTTSVGTTRSDASLRDVIAIMHASPFHHLPVVDGGKLAGMLSWRDLARAGVVGAFPGEDGARPVASALRVADIMQTELITVASTDELALAISLLAEGIFNSLPVVDGDRLVGILTTSDIMRRVLEG